MVLRPFSLLNIHNYLSGLNLTHLHFYKTGAIAFTTPKSRLDTIMTSTVHNSSPTKPDNKTSCEVIPQKERHIYIEPTEVMSPLRWKSSLPSSLSLSENKANLSIFSTASPSASSIEDLVLELEESSQEFESTMSAIDGKIIYSILLLEPIQCIRYSFPI